MTQHQNRVAAGIPAGGQFAAKTYTEADIELAASSVQAANERFREARAESNRAIARFVGRAALGEHPEAVSLELEPSDQEGCSWDIAHLLDADGNEIEASDDLRDSVVSYLWDLPDESYDDIPDVEAAEDSDWLVITSRSRHNPTARIRLHIAAAE